MEYLAHIKRDENGNITATQPVADHCRSAGAYASECLEEIGLKETAYLAGLVHDAGKMKEEFQTYLQDEAGIRGSVNHTFAGCRMLLERFHIPGDMKSLTAELLAFAAGAHHGLFDCGDERKQSGFLHRLEKQGIGYAESRRGFFAKP